MTQLRGCRRFREGAASLLGDTWLRRRECRRHAAEVLVGRGLIGLMERER